MTSPARCTITMSPLRTSSRSISSALCKVARATIDAADIDRLEVGDGRQRTGAADLDEDIVQTRARLLGRELVGDRPARRAAHEAQPLLPVDTVDLVDDAVDVVGQRRPLDAHLAIECAHLLGRAAELGQRIDLKPQSFSSFRYSLWVFQERGSASPQA